MSIFQADAVLRTSVQLFLDDLRKNLWLIDDILADFVNNPYLKEIYGQKQVDACKEWFTNNNIDVYIGYHPDKLRPPCISIRLGPQPEKEEMKLMADKSTDSVILMPNQIGKPIPYIIKPFIPTGYDDSTGIVGVDSAIDLSGVTAGMILVNPDNGNGYVIQDIVETGILIEADLDISASKLGVVPQFAYYQAEIEHIFQQGNYEVVCTAHGDPQNVLWLHDIVLYGLLRYKQSLLEALGFSESVFSTGELELNREIGNDNAEPVWDRVISITGQIEQSFIKSPNRIIESVVLKEKAPKGTKASKGYRGGIKIISNLDTPNFIDQSDETWTTEEDED